MLGVLTVSTLTHDWQAHANQPMARLVLFYLMPAGLYWVARQSPISPREVRGMFVFLGLLGVYVAATAIAEWQYQSWLVYPQYISAASDPEFLGRARGPLLNPMGNGILMTVCLASTLAWWPQANRPCRLLLLALTGMYALGVYGTLTRCAWISAAAGLCLVVAFYLPRFWRVPILSVGVVAAGVLTAAYWQEWWLFAAIRAFGQGDGRVGVHTAGDGPGGLEHVPAPSPVGLRIRPIRGRVGSTISTTARPSCSWRKPGGTCSTTCSSRC